MAERPFRYLFCLIFLLQACATLRTEQRNQDGVRSEEAHSQPIPLVKTEEIEKQNSVQTEEAKKSAASAEYHFSLAQAFTAEGNVNRAIEEYKLTLMHDPNSALVNARLSAEYIKKGMLSLAMEAAKEALRLDPNFVDARLILAGLYSTTRETNSALNEYNRILEQDPLNEEATIYKAQVQLEDHKSEEGLATLKKFLDRNSSSPLVWYYYGRAKQIEEDLDGAIVAYRQALILHSGFTQAALALGYIYESKEMNDQAKQVYADIYDDNQDLTAANRIATLYLKEQKYKEAIPYLEAIRLGDSSNMNAMVKLGLIHMELKNYPQAISIFNSILLENPDSDRIHYYLGSLYEEIEDYPRAITTLKKVPADSKLYEDATLHVTYLLKQTNQEKAAKKHIEEALKSNPNYASFYIFQASMEEEASNLNGAVKILENATDLFPEHERLRYYLGSLYDRQGNTEKSLNQMEAILRTNADHADALNYIGYTWTVQGIHLDDARKMIEKALSLRPDSGYILDSWGWYLYTVGRVSEAVVQLEKAATLAPKESSILEHLGDAYLRSNLRDKALLQYQEAAQFAKEDKVRKQIENKMNHLQTEIARSRSDTDRAPAANATSR